MYLDMGDRGTRVEGIKDREKRNLEEGEEEIISQSFSLQFRGQSESQREV